MDGFEQRDGQGRAWNRGWAGDTGACLGGCRRCLPVADVVGSDGVEAVVVAFLTGVGRTGLRCGKALPQREGAAVVRDEDSEARDAGAVGIVLAGPRERE